MSTPQNLLLIGATGQIGKHITNSIVGARSHFKRIAILTSPSTLSSKADLISSLKSQGVEIISGDVTKESDVKSAYQGIDTVISAVGRTAIALQVDLVKWATESGSVKKFFPSEYGTDIDYEAKSKSEKPHQAKWKVRHALESSGLEYTYVVVGPYPEMFLTSGLPDEYGTFDVKNKKATLLGDGEGKVSFTTMPDVGKLVLSALLHPSRSLNRALKVNSFTTTPHAILTEYEKQTNAKWSVNYTSLQQLKDLETAAWNHNDPRAALMTLRRIWTEGGTLYEKTDNDVIEAPEMGTLEDQVRLAIEKAGQ